MITNDPGITFVPFHWGHAYAMDLREHDARYFRSVPNFRDMLRQYQETGNAKTAMMGGKIICCFGYVELWQGVAEMWMLTSNHIETHPVAATRGAQRHINHIATETKLKRLQITVDVTHVVAMRWADALKFNREGVLRHYGADGADYMMFARYFDGQLGSRTNTAATRPGGGRGAAETRGAP